jgi:hypothetical protein
MIKPNLLLFTEEISGEIGTGNIAQLEEEDYTLLDYQVEIIKLETQSLDYVLVLEDTTILP